MVEVEGKRALNLKGGGIGAVRAAVVATRSSGSGGKGKRANW